MEKGQVTVFVIVGIIILFLAVLVLYLSSESFKTAIQEQRAKLVGVPQEFRLVDASLSECVAQTARNTLNNVPLQGGYYNPSDAVLVPQDLSLQQDTGILLSLIGTGYTINVTQRYIPVAYWFKERDISPSREKVEAELSRYFDDFLPDCLDERLGELVDQGYEFTTPRVSSSFSMNRRKVVVEAVYPLEVEYKGASFKPSRQRVELESELFDLFSIAKDVVASISRNPDEIPFSGLSDTGFRTNVFSHEDNIIYTIADNRTVMTFAVQA